MAKPTEEIIGHVLLLVQQASGYSDIDAPRGASDDDIDALEQRFGIVVPAELRMWLSLWNGPRIDAELIDLDTISTLLQRHHSWVDKGWIPVAGDGCGDYYVLDMCTPTPTGHPILFIDHEIDYDAADYVVASGLWQFLLFFLRSALEGDDDWPFDARKVLADDPALADYKGAPKPWDLD